MNLTPVEVTLNGWTPGSEWQAAYREEEKTHRHLSAGDIYGGKDWNFVFTIGTSQVDRPRQGEPCDPCLGYRIRRKR